MTDEYRVSYKAKGSSEEWTSLESSLADAFRQVRTLRSYAWVVQSSIHVEVRRITPWEAVALPARLR